MSRSARIALLTLPLVALLLLAGPSLHRPVAVHADEHRPVEHELTFAVLNTGEWFRVRVRFYLSDTATEADLEAATEGMAARFPGAYRQSESAVSAQFALSGPTWPGNTLTWHYNPAGSADAVGDGMTGLSAAAGTWNAAGADFAFVHAGYTTAGTGACGTERDGLNTIGWRQQTGGILAVTCTWSRGTESGGEVFVEADMEFDPGWNWTTTETGVSTDFESVALHEFGHALGLGHATDGCPGAVMCPSYTMGRLLRSLASDDLDGLFAVYGSAPARPAEPPYTAQPQERGTFRIVAPMISRN